MTLYATQEQIADAFGSAFDDESTEMIDDLLYQLFSKLVCPCYEVPVVERCISAPRMRDIVLRLIEPTGVLANGGQPIHPDSAIGELIYGLIGLGECIAEARMAYLFGVSRAVIGSVISNVGIQTFDAANDFEERTKRFARLLAHEARADVAGVEP